MTRGMAELSHIDVQSVTALLAFVDLSYPWTFVDGVTDDVYGGFVGTFQSIDTTAPVVFRTLCRTSGAPTGQVVFMAVAYKIIRRGAIVSSAYMPGLSFAAFDLTAGKNPGVINTEWRWITWATFAGGTFLEGDRVHIRFSRGANSPSDTLGTNLYIHENGFSWFYPVTRPGGLG